MTREQARNLLNNSKLKGNNAYSLMLNEALNIAIEALEQESCDDCISRKEVLGIDFKKIILTTANPTEMIEQKVKALPSVNSQPKIGHWVKHSTGHSVYYDCSLCSCIAPCTETADNWLWKLSKYCPDCGAKMEHGGEW